MINAISFSSPKAKNVSFKRSFSENYRSTEPIPELSFLKSIGIVVFGASFTSMGIDVFTNIYNQMAKNRKPIPFSQMFRNATIWSGIAILGYSLVKLFDDSDVKK